MWTWHMLWYDEHYETISWSIALDFLKDMSQFMFLRCVAIWVFWFFFVAIWVVPIWVLNFVTRWVLSFVTIWVFEFCHNLSWVLLLFAFVSLFQYLIFFLFCHSLRFLVFSVFSFGYNFRFRVFELSQFKFLICHKLSFWVVIILVVTIGVFELSQFE